MSLLRTPVQQQQPLRFPPLQTNAPTVEEKDIDISTCFKLHPELKTKKLTSNPMSSDFHMNLFVGGNDVPCRALIDTGSDCNIMRPDLLQRLNPTERTLPCKHRISHGSDSSVTVNEAIDTSISFKTVCDKLYTAPIRCLISDVSGDDELIISGQWAKFSDVTSIFGKIDARSDFHQVVVDEDSRKFLAFTTKYGIYQYTRRPFGARNASAHFQQAMVSAFSDLIPHVCDIFLDDIIIKGKDEFCHHLDLVLGREEMKLRAKASKYVFGYQRLEFLGREISENGISPAISRVQDLKSLKVLKDKSQCRSMLGLFNFFRSFVVDYARKVAPIQILTRKGTTFMWKEEQQTAFDTIIADISQRTLLHYIDYDKRIVLQSDASDLAIGGVLLQYGKHEKRF
ncbi:hypothetical protein ADUPG1_010599 [Aduncisulcus paluster]|uniref:Reverse transcriptase domain-containing protein n=1 Tax=Aduncisulcus paluster TaxID=2918883 RepID=A0ABQ5JVP7_9EUKA|nr:hypothetical protein ADUPG1_010599 [Aduncisulcus paluster]